MIFVAASAAVIGFIAHEVGTYCQELNPYNDDLIKDMGSDFDCEGCMGAAFGDCDYCASKHGCRDQNKR